PPAPLRPDDARRILAPAAGARAEVDDTHAGAQQPFLFMNLRELEYGPGAPPLPDGALHIGIPLLPRLPAATGPATSTHLFSSNGADEGGAHNKKRMHLTEEQSNYLRILGHTLTPVIDVGPGGV